MTSVLEGGGHWSSNYDLVRTDELLLTSETLYQTECPRKEWEPSMYVVAAVWYCPLHPIISIDRAEAV